MPCLDSPEETAAPTDVEIMVMMMVVMMMKMILLLAVSRSHLR